MDPLTDTRESCKTPASLSLMTSPVAVPRNLGFPGTHQLLLSLTATDAHTQYEVTHAGTQLQVRGTEGCYADLTHIWRHASLETELLVQKPFRTVWNITVSQLSTEEESRSLCLDQRAVSAVTAEPCAMSSCPSANRGLRKTPETSWDTARPGAQQ